MVRAPAKTCPNLSRLFDDAEPKLLSGFLESKAFERLTWLVPYKFDPNNPDGPTAARNMLPQEKKDRTGSARLKQKQRVSSQSRVTAANTFSKVSPLPHSNPTVPTNF